MSETTNQPMFGGASTARKPGKACIGRVASIGDIKLGEAQEGKPQYIQLQIQLEGYGAGPNQRVSLFFRPEWLRPGYNPETLVDQYGEVGEKMLNTYRRNIYEKDGEKSGNLSTLLGLCGSLEALSVLAQRLFEVNPESETYLEDVKEVFVQFFVEDGYGQDVGYDLKQQEVATGEIGENGRPVYRPTAYMEVAKFWFDTEKNRKARYARAARDNKKFQVTFTEDDVPATSDPVPF